MAVLLLIDLDHFKTINDALGHQVGDMVLQAVAQRLREAVGERSLFARLGSDEFGLLLTNEASQSHGMAELAEELAQRILAAISRPVFVEERAFNVGASIGMALFPENGDTELDVMRHADMALHQAKVRKRGSLQLYQVSFQDQAAKRLRLGDGLRKAISHDELELYF